MVQGGRYCFIDKALLPHFDVIYSSITKTSERELYDMHYSLPKCQCWNLALTCYTVNMRQSRLPTTLWLFSRKFFFPLKQSLLYWNFLVIFLINFTMQQHKTIFYLDCYIADIKPKCCFSRLCLNIMATFFFIRTQSI